ncbi:MAG: DUF4440 domain-containing protein [Chloroflexota bacterium]
MRHLEESLWREETRFDIVYMEEILAGDFFEFGRSGRVYSRDETLAVSREPFEARLPLIDFTVRAFGVDVVQVTYTSEVTYNGVIERGRRSSIWSKTADGWELRFHQGTKLS